MYCSSTCSLYLYLSFAPLSSSCRRDQGNASTRRASATIHHPPAASIPGAPPKEGGGRAGAASSKKQGGQLSVNSVWKHAHLRYFSLSLSLQFIITFILFGLGSHSPGVSVVNSSRAFEERRSERTGQETGNSRAAEQQQDIASLTLLSLLQPVHSQHATRLQASRSDIHSHSFYTHKHTLTATRNNGGNSAGKGARGQAAERKTKGGLSCSPSTLLVHRG